MVTLVTRLLRVGLIQCGIATAVLGLVELALRVGTGGPLGLFQGWFPGRAGLYPENSEIAMPGVVPWLIRTNRWGFRGEDLPMARTPGMARIAMLGDSVTDGFFVDNEDTYPAMTASRLRTAGARAEVINAASGGASIDTELAVLRDAVTPFHPDVAVLTFVTNDVAALSGLDDKMLLRKSLGQRSRAQTLLRQVVVETALGEWLFDSYLRWRSPAYNRSTLATRIQVDRRPDRYQLPEGSDFAQNSKRFMERFKGGDALLLSDHPSSEVQILIQRYLLAWDVFTQQAREREMTPVFVYFPAYPQIYDPASSMLMRDRLEEHCRSKGVPFLDLTPALRAQGKAVLHLAPSDYHLNPEGNRVIGTALADFLVERALVDATSGGVRARR
jgi:lysophospholipase L1-like esterase